MFKHVSRHRYRLKQVYASFAFIAYVQTNHSFSLKLLKCQSHVHELYKKRLIKVGLKYCLFTQGGLWIFNQILEI